MDTIKLRQVGNSVEATFPQVYLQHMNVEAGDELFITKEPDGRLTLSPSKFRRNDGSPPADQNKVS